MTETDIKRIRAALGLTQRELAERLGVRPNTVTRWEMGLHKIPGPAARLLEVMRAGARKEGKGTKS